MLKLEGAIFDMDGTLLDSMYIWETYGSDYLKECGVQPRTGVDEITVAMSLQHTAQYLKREYGLTKTEEAIVKEINRMVENQYFRVVQPKPGIPKTLKRLHEKGVRMAVATATDRYQVEAALERCGLLKYFSGIFTGPEHGSKNEPEIFETALLHLGTKREKTAVFDDALYALRTAKTAGFPVVAIYDRSQKKTETVIRSVADMYLESFEEWEKIQF